MADDNTPNGGATSRISFKKVMKKSLANVGRKFSTAERVKVNPAEITLEDVEKRLEQLRRGEMYMFRPDSSFISKWDVVIMICLLFTASVTPYEVALLKVQIGTGFLFWVNRLVDTIFLVDMGVQFSTMYYDGVGRLIKTRSRIVQKYMHGWFTIDFITVLPYDFVELFAPDAVQLLKVIRLARLLKLFRLLRASRIFLRWETKLGFQHSSYQLAKLVAMLLFFNHWFSCLWVLAAGLKDDNSYTWVSAWLGMYLPPCLHLKTAMKPLYQFRFIIRRTS
jgi:potassium voltage-gated channel Eag-related subfamily H protein 7